MLKKFSFSSRSPQECVKFLVMTTGALSLFVALTASLPFVNTLVRLFAISPYSAQHLWLWQLITHIFIFPTDGFLSAGYILSLFFNLYFLWAIGTQMALFMGIRRFLTLYLGSAIISGGVVMASLILFPTPALYAGCHTALMAMLLSWTFVNPQMSVLVFMTIPVPAKWLIAGLAGIHLLTDFANGQFISFLSLASALLFGYFFSLFTLERLSPYPFLHRFETACLKLKQRRRSQRRHPSYANHSKIFDFKTGESIDISIESANGDKASSWKRFFSLFRR